MLRRVQTWQTPDVDSSSDVRPGEGLAGLAFSEAKPVIINDYQASDLARRRGRDRGLRAGLGVPLIPNGKPLGVLLISSYDDTTQFSDDDARLLDLFGDQAAAALISAEAFEEQSKAVAELERVNKVKSEFVAIVSHEFRTPLTGIQGFSEMMRDEDLTLAELKEYATDINKDARRLNRLVNEMLDLSRMESGRMQLSLEKIDLNAIVQEVVATMQPTAPKHTFTLRLDATLPKLMADRDKITQVVTNLRQQRRQVRAGRRRDRPDDARRRQPGAPDGGRQRRGHAEGDARARLRAVLAGRERAARRFDRDRARLADRPPDRQAAWRPGLGRQRRRARARPSTA